MTQAILTKRFCIHNTKICLSLSRQIHLAAVAKLLLLEQLYSPRVDMLSQVRYGG